MLRQYARRWDIEALRTTASHSMRMISTSMTEAPERAASTEGLTDTLSVAKYLKQTPFAPREIRRIQLGSTNFTYRLFLDKPYGPERVRTAILKYAAPHTQDEPPVEFSSDRQTYEARAMRMIPWKQLMSLQRDASVSESIKPFEKLRVPELYLEDAKRRVVIMEDGTPRRGSDEVWQERSHSARIFFEEVPSSSQKYETARLIGQLLGSFLARLHNWGDSPENAALVFDSFAGNTAAKDLTTQETFKDFWKNVERTGFVVPDHLKAELETKLHDLQEQVRNNLETVVMGDFWPGNILLSFTDKDELERLSIIDWEFIMLAPAFLDTGHFIGEVFLIHYFESNDEVYIVLLESFMRAYRSSLVRDIDTENILAYAGAHIMVGLPRRINSLGSRATKENASPFVEQTLKFITDPKFITQSGSRGPGDAFERVLDLMRDRMANLA
ncbi:hypothetical protein AJ80_07830 [Polytolypa hystricis UAMH7299]|uniref:Uncharacterized protein n=1 Tax=Polytolypa hystricis (strain UAMH7299) TaxID=1447883 RepID=A0A2B7XHW5_POLH7|nr:hypothetical protein AJ80_07830 [Polytolypa hystricis UAMH7299]